MKIKSIAAICKKNKNIAIFERYSDDGDILTQYIGDGSAVYPVVGLPPLDAESLLTIFDVPEKDRDNYFVKTLGIPAGISLLLLSIPYGMTTNYVAMYAKEIGINATTGFFFTFMAVGMAISRIFSGKIVDKGKITQVISAGLYIVVFSFFLLSACVYIINWNSMACGIIFFAVALLLGVGFGIMFPAYNTLFVNLAPNNQRGTATSTYLTSWDVGIGIGMLTGGYIAEVSTFDKAYLFGACLTIISMLYFNGKVTPHYHKNKLR